MRAQTAAVSVLATAPGVRRLTGRTTSVAPGAAPPPGAADRGEVCCGVAGSVPGAAVDSPAAATGEVPAEAMTVGSVVGAGWAVVSLPAAADGEVEKNGAEGSADGDEAQPLVARQSAAQIAAAPARDIVRILATRQPEQAIVERPPEAPLSVLLQATTVPRRLLWT